MHNVRKCSLKILSILVLTLFASQVSLSQVKKTSAPEIGLTDEFPSGKWSISYHPYQGESNPDLPVVVYSVVSKNLKVTQIRVTNVSTKPIKAIKVRWLVYENQNRDNLLAQGQTSLIRFVGSVDSGNSGTISYPVVSFADVHKSFLVNGKLDKELNVDLLVDEVNYLDGSTWLAKNGKSKDIVANLFKKVSFQDCARQACKGTASTQKKDGTTYSCVASSLSELCTNTGTSCTNSSCASGGGGGVIISPEVEIEN